MIIPRPTLRYLKHISPFYALSLLTVSIATYVLYLELTVNGPRRRFRKQRKCLPPKKFRTLDPFFGIDYLIRISTHLKTHTVLAFSQSIFRDLSANTWSIKLLGIRIVTTAEPENIKCILATCFGSFGVGKSREAALGPLLGKGIFTSDGVEWQHSRDMLRPSFMRGSMTGDLELMEKHVGRLIERIPCDGSTIDLQPLFLRLTLDIATACLVGESTNCLLVPDEASSEGLEFAKAFDRCQSTLAGNGKWGLLAAWFPDPQWKEDVKLINDFVDNFVSKSQMRDPLSKSPISSSNPVPISDIHAPFLESIALYNNSSARIRSELLNILSAGRDTTASLLSNLFFLLSRPEHAGILKRLRDEIAYIIPFPSPPESISQLKSLRYLNAALNETLRLYPIVPENSREVVMDTVLPIGGGPDGHSPVFVKKGDWVSWSIYTMHRRMDIFGEDADIFRPERWLDGHSNNAEIGLDEKEEERKGKGLRPGWAFLPFNGGPRSCLGQQFALTEAAYTTVRLLQTFSGMKSRDPEAWREKFSIICTGAGGCKIAFEG